MLMSVEQWPGKVMRSGELAERAARRYLQESGLSIVAQNYRCKVGEIDLICRDNSSLVFVEVRFRKHRRFGTAAETVDPRKQRKIYRAANYYLQQHRLDVSCRFDVLAVSPVAADGSDPTNFRFHWIRNALFDVN
jgi:putative endonuclease